MNAKFCSQCGSALNESAKFCSACGHAVGGSESLATAPTASSSSRGAASGSVRSGIDRFFTALGGGVLVGIGLVALQSALTLPSEAQYVTFQITTNNLIQGGWFTWYSGPIALLASASGEPGMEGGPFRILLWLVGGFGVAVGVSIFKAMSGKEDT